MPPNLVLICIGRFGERCHTGSLEVKVGCW
jgi:hypothetical protein